MMASAGAHCILGYAELRPGFLAEHIMVMPAVHEHRWTIEEVNRLIDEREGMSPRYELVDGELLVTPAPAYRHQRIILDLAVRLRVYGAREKIAEVILGPGELKLAADAHFEPDIFVIPGVDGRLPSAEAPGPHAPLLVCEVLSPSSSRHDRIKKRRYFQTHAVPEYWIVDGDAQVFEVWRPLDERPSIVDSKLVWHPPSAANPFELDIPAFFASVADNAPLP